MNTYENTERTDELKKDMDRVFTIWSDCRKQYDANGPFLFGKYSVADMMYAPVVFRLKGYQIDLPDIIDEYCNTVIAYPDVQEWLTECDANDKG